MIAFITALTLANAAPVSLELFTSQSCSSCPAAEALFRDYAKRDDLVALEWHVDYWDKLPAGPNGAWRDVYSSKANTARQYAYNKKIRGRSTVYTPQAVIGGRTETVGSRKRTVDSLISNAAPATGATIEMRRDGDKIALNTTGPEGATVRLVRFINAATTRVRAGENDGRDLAEAHVVTEASAIAAIGEKPVASSFDAPAPGHGCAILVEEGGEGGPVIAAQYCPS
ncbi:MAG: DUF1223 domain-containing protein [Parvularculaceae bacterium]